MVVLSNATIRSENETVSIEDLGKVENVNITKDEIIFSVDRDVDYYIDSLKEELDNLNEFDSYFMKERICKLETGMATIYVGGITKTEIKEKKMRIEDAINALEVAYKGVTIGSGIKYLEISEKLDLGSDGARVITSSLVKPFQKIMANCGEDYLKWKEIIKNSKYENLYNLKTKTLEDIKSTGVLDPVEVMKTALKNATSIASMLLTTNYLVINENIDKNNSENYL